MSRPVLAHDTQRLPRSRRRARPRGYTVVELLMSLTVLAIGTSGVIAMQKVTLASNAHAKNLAVATRIASAWADALAADASQWNTGSDMADTVWLNEVNSNELVWIRPAHDGGRDFGPGFSPLGDPVGDTTLARYCTDIRLAWVRSNLNHPGAGLIRAEIRVFWKRDGAVTTSGLPADMCDSGSNPATNLNTDAAANGYHFVFLTTAIAQTGTGA